MNPDPLFSNDESYFHNDTFQRHIIAMDMLRVNPFYSPAERVAVSEIIRHDIYLDAKHWLDTFKKAEWWREGLE